MTRIWIKRIVLKNFESHSESEIDLVEGFNCLVGQSCSGKTSIIRAIRSVSVPNSFCQSFVREGYPFCTIRIETNAGWLSSDKGEGVNRFTYFIDGETEKEVSMKSPAGKEFEIAKRILGIESLRIESTGDKRKTNSRVDVNLQKQANNLGLLGESGKNKALTFDALAGIEDASEVREGIKSKISELKKKEDSLMSELSQVKLGMIAPLKVQTEKDAYNDLADSFDDIDCQRKTLIEINSSFSIREERKNEVEALGNKLFKDYWLPEGGIIDLFRANSKKWNEEMGEIQRLGNSREWLVTLISSTGKDIDKLGVVDVSQIVGLKELAGKLFHVEQFVTARVAQEAIELKIDSLGGTVDTGGTRVLIEKTLLLDRFGSIAREILDSEMKLKGLAVVCSVEKDKALLVAVDEARDIYKRMVALKSAIEGHEDSIDCYKKEIEELTESKRKLFEGVEKCPVTGKGISNAGCSVYLLKEGKE